MSLRALIFDVDGTLAETEDLHRRAFNDAFAAAGLGWHWSEAEYARLLSTTGGKERLRRYRAETGASSGPEVAALHADKTRRYAALVAEGGLALRPGIAALMAQARAAGLRLAVATTTSRPNVEALALAGFGRPADAVFDVLACGDEVARKKPAPDVYRLALARLGLGPHQALAFEDSAMGVAAARGAGLGVVAAPSLYTRGSDLSAASRVVADFSALAAGGIDGLQPLSSPGKGCSAALSGNTTRSA